MGHSFEITKQLLYIQNSITNEVLNALQYIVDWELAHPENERTANDCEQLNKDLAAYEYRIKQEFCKYLCLYKHNKLLSDTMERSILENMRRTISPCLVLNKDKTNSFMPWVNSFRKEHL
jgi:hypothetical protein|nr:MAG TPA: hypothetical protein [Caudoviricetes sp.]